MVKACNLYSPFIHLLPWLVVVMLDFSFKKLKQGRVVSSLDGRSFTLTIHVIWVGHSTAFQYLSILAIHTITREIRVSWRVMLKIERSKLCQESTATTHVSSPPTRRPPPFNNEQVHYTMPSSSSSSPVFTILFVRPIRSEPLSGWWLRAKELEHYLQLLLVRVVFLDSQSMRHWLVKLDKLTQYRILRHWR